MIKSLLDNDEQPEPDSPSSSGDPILTAVSPRGTADNEVITDAETGEKEPFILASSSKSSSTAESVAETARRSGLAYSAALAFFASVVFMLVIGWGADLLFGTSPWGMVAGIVLGSVIGFIQFFRINSQIFRTDEKMKNGRMLLTRDDDQK